MGVQKKYKDYKIYRRFWWKFWQIDQLEFTLSSRYEDAYEEVEKKLINGTQWSMELKSWVIDDLREQLSSRILTYNKLVKKSKKLSVRFGTSGSGQRFSDRMDFYVWGEDIYFDSDESIKRERLLNKLGI